MRCGRDRCGEEQLPSLDHSGGHFDLMTWRVFASYRSISKVLLAFKDADEDGREKNGKRTYKDRAKQFGNFIVTVASRLNKKEMK